MSVFGTWTYPRQIELAYIEHVNKWLATFIAEAERQFGIPARAVPVPARGQFTVSREEFQKYPEHQTPAVLVMAPGLAGEPRREADRSLTAPIALAFGVVAASPHIEDAAAEIAQLIGVAIREIVLRLRPEDLDVKAVRLVDERYGDIEKRTMGSARIVFTIDVAGWSPGKGGPVSRTDPPVDPYDPPGDLTTVQPGKTFVQLSNARSLD